MTDDAILVAAAQRGDRAAIETLLERHIDRIHAVCRRIVGNDHDAFDATQEALIAITRSITRFDGRAAFGTWCYRVAVNAALDELRRRKRRPIPDDDLAANPTVAPWTPSGPSTDAVDARLDVDAALAHVDEDFRVAVILRDLCDLDYAEIAAVLAVPIGTVRSRISRGRAALAARLREPQQPSETSK